MEAEQVDLTKFTHSTFLRCKHKSAVATIKLAGPALHAFGFGSVEGSLMPRTCEHVYALHVCQATAAALPW